jgi:hypothetical protein
MKKIDSIEILSKRTLLSGTSAFEEKVVMINHGIETVYEIFANTTSGFVETGHYALSHYPDHLLQLKIIAADFIPKGIDPLCDFTLLSFASYQIHNSITESRNSSHGMDQWELLEKNTALAINLSFATYSAVAFIGKVVVAFEPSSTFLSTLSARLFLPFSNTIFGIGLLEQAANFYQKGFDLKLSEVLAWSSGVLKFGAMADMSVDAWRTVTIPDHTKIIEETQKSTKRMNTNIDELKLIKNQIKADDTLNPDLFNSTIEGLEGFLRELTTALDAAVPHVIVMALTPKTLSGSIIKWASGLRLVAYGMEATGIDSTFGDLLQVNKKVSAAEL